MKGSIYPALLILNPAGCTIALTREEGQCSTHADCQALNAAYLCTLEGVCVPWNSDDHTRGTGDLGACRDSVDCITTGAPSVCRSGRCQALEDTNLGCISRGWGTTPIDGADALVVGMLVSKQELTGDAARRPITGTVGTAITEFNRARGDGLLPEIPPIIGVACDEENPQALTYLLDSLRVPLIIGPSDPKRLEFVLTQTERRAVLSPPYASGPNLESDLGDLPGIVLNCRPNRRGIWPYLLDAVRDTRSWLGELATPGLVTRSTALAVSSDSPTTSFAAGFTDAALGMAEVRRVSYEDGPGGLGFVSAMSEINPPVNLVVAASGEDAWWQDNIAAFDAAAYQAQGVYPYYLLSEKRVSVSESAIADQVTVAGFPRQHSRFIGLDYHRSDESQLAAIDFANGFYAHTQAPAEPEFEYTYDCTYVALYSAIAAGLRLHRSVVDLTANEIPLGVRALQGGESKLPVRSFDIPDVVARLVASAGVEGSLDLIGVSGELNFEFGGANEGAVSMGHTYLGVTAPDGEFYCIDAIRKNFCDTGIVFPASGGAARRGDNSCECFGDLQ